MHIESGNEWLRNKAGLREKEKERGRSPFHNIQMQSAPLQKLAIPRFLIKNYI